jgi:hypothetical protein
MAAGTPATWVLEQEARALLTRLALVRPFVLHETMVPAAAISHSAQLNIDRFLDAGRRRLREQVNAFVAWIRGPAGRQADPALAQRRFSLLRLRFNAVLTQFDTFADVITQRSEHETGPWLAGLDVVAADALTLPGRFYEPPPVICYLDRGAGAAIRRARTRLPGAAAIPSPSSACRASAWSAAALLRRLCTKSVTRAHRCSTSSLPCVPSCRAYSTGVNEIGWSGAFGTGGSGRLSPTSGRSRRLG